MSDSLRDLLMNGFMIYPSHGKFVVKKELVPHSNYILPEKEFNSYAEAVEYAIESLQKPRLMSWKVTLRYNRGLGVEYRSLSDILADSKEQAIVAANEVVETLIKAEKIISYEIKVQMKNS